MAKFLQFILPLACYFLVEQLWGYAWGTLAGVLLCIVSAGIGVARGEKQSVKDVAADAGLVLIFGVGDMVADSLSAEVAPVITSTLLAIIAYSLSAKAGMGIMGRMLDDLRPGTSENPFAMKLVSGSMRRMSAWAFVAAAIYEVGAMTSNSSAREWIDSYLLITILLACVATEIVVSRMTKRKYRDVEWVPLMTEDGRTVGGAPRPLVHNGSRWLHAVVHLHVVNSKGELLLQLRPKTKKIQPGRWDTAVGGHITFGENLQKALQRETMEEIGLTDFEAQFKGHYVWKCEAENEYVFVFTTKSDGPFEPKNVGEVDELRFWSAADLKAAIGTGTLTPNIEKELHEWLLNAL